MNLMKQMAKPVFVRRGRTYGGFDLVTMLLGPAVIIVGCHFWVWLSSSSSPLPLSTTPIFFVINDPPTKLVGMVQ